MGAFHDEAKERLERRTHHRAFSEPHHEQEMARTYGHWSEAGTPWRPVATLGPMGPTEDEEPAAAEQPPPLVLPGLGDWPPREPQASGPSFLEELDFLTGPMRDVFAGGATDIAVEAAEAGGAETVPGLGEILHAGGAIVETARAGYGAATGDRHGAVEHTAEAVTDLAGILPGVSEMLGAGDMAMAGASTVARGVHADDAGQDRDSAYPSSVGGLMGHVWNEELDAQLGAPEAHPHTSVGQGIGGAIGGALGLVPGALLPGAFVATVPAGAALGRAAGGAIEDWARGWTE